MSLSLNRVMLAGNLTRDPQIKYIGSDKTVASFGLAINRRYKDSAGQPKEETTFVDVEAWGRTAELVGQYLTKGRPVYIEGRLKLEGWETKDGEKRQRIKVVADNVQFLGSKPKDEGAAPATASSSAPARSGPASNPADDEPPF